MEKQQIRLAIVGLGLLGASLGMALRGGAFRRLGWSRRAEVRSWAVANDVVDETADDLAALLGTADITLLALPIPQIIGFIERYAKDWKPGSIVSDIGSVKGVILDAGVRHLSPRGVHFVGAHPMAGTEKSGHEWAFPELYNHAEVFIVPAPGVPEEKVRMASEIWSAIGAKIVPITASAHDALLAHTSHLLHVVASALTLGILGDDDPEIRALRFSGCATGFKDSARIAASNPAMWREIVENNRPAVLAAMDEFERRLGGYRSMIEEGRFDDFENAFLRGKELRDEWNEYKMKIGKNRK